MIDLETGGETDLVAGNAEDSSTDISTAVGLAVFLTTAMDGKRMLCAADWRDGALSHRRRVLANASDCAHPTLAGDGSCIYFGRRSNSAQQLAAIYRVGPDKWYDAGNPPPEKLADVPGIIGRLSAFPDNRRLLVWHSKGLDVLDVETRKLTPLGLPELHDPDLPDGKPLVVQEPAVSPDGKQIAFSAVRSSGQPEEPSGQYIYVCNLDGTGLKRITPLEDVVVPPYIFPATGKPAFEVPEEYAKPYTMP